MALLFSFSICASADAQIESLSVVDNTLYAKLSEKNIRFYVAGYNEGLLTDVFFCDSQDGQVELHVNDAGEYKLFLWDMVTLAPLSCTYNLKGSVAYPSNSTDPIPQYDFTPYKFDQEDNVMVVSSVSDEEIIGFKAGKDAKYCFADEVTVLGLSDSIADIVPGSVVLIGTDQSGNCRAIELLASIGIPVCEETFTSSFGSYLPSDGSCKYTNVVTELFSKSGSKITTMHFPGKDHKVPISFESYLSKCYRVGISMDGDVPVISCTEKVISAHPSIFEDTSKYHNYLYLRYNNEAQNIKEAVFYCVPKNFNPGAGDGEYSDIFGAGNIIIIE